MGVLKIYHVKSSKTPHIDLQGNVIEVGEEYFWTKANFHTKKICSKNSTEIDEWIRNYVLSQRGEFSINMESWSNRIVDIQSEDEREDVWQEVNDFLEQKRQNLENMPEQFQESHMLNDQISAIEDLLQEIESIEIES